MLFMLADGASGEIFTYFFRTLLVYILLLVLIRIMGKREIGNLSPIDLVVTIMIADAAIIAVQEPKPLWIGVVPMLTLVMAEIVFSYIFMKNVWIRDMFSGRPTMIIEDGRVNVENMRKLRYNINDLMSQLREKNMADLTDVKYAILESTGKLSVVPKPERRHVMLEDVMEDIPDERLPVLLISDGQVLHYNLSSFGMDISWLRQELKKQGVENEKQVFIAIRNSRNQLFVQKKELPKS